MASSLRTVVPEAPLERVDNGIRVAGDGWFVVNAKEIPGPPEFSSMPG
jgi:hypothetical protein